MESSFFNLASDYFFFSYFFNQEYVHRNLPLYFKKDEGSEELEVSIKNFLYERSLEEDSEVFSAKPR